jgi:phosphinothricin acetyltransferase
MEITIDPIQPADGAAVLAIYAMGIAGGQATFETNVPAWEQWDQSHLPVCRLAARCAAELVGWAALSPVSKRTAYTGVAEVSVYVHGAYHGQGIGRALLEELIRQSEATGFWTLQSSLFPENTASVGLHQKCGFRLVGHRQKIARLNGACRDTFLFERRSSKF